VRIARRLGCTTLLIPQVGAALSAAGALMSDLKADFRAAHFASTARFDYAAAARVVAGLETSCRAFIDGPGAGALETGIAYTLDARYATQVWEIEVPLRTAGIATPDDLAAFVADFHATHAELFAFDDPASPIEIIGWSAQAHCRFAQAEGLALAPETEQPPAIRTRPAYFSGAGWTDVIVRPFETIAGDEIVAGPAMIESAFTTVVLDPGAVASRKPSGSLAIRVSP
jgi:N-methylhydantoinase A